MVFLQCTTTSLNVLPNINQFKSDAALQVECYLTCCSFSKAFLVSAEIFMQPGREGEGYEFAVFSPLCSNSSPFPVLTCCRERPY